MTSPFTAPVNPAGKIILRGRGVGSYMDMDGTFAALNRLQRSHFELYSSLSKGVTATLIPTTNILQKTFLIQQGKSRGTAFAIESDGREYLITARHVVPDELNAIDILHDEKWKELPVTGIYHHPGEPDVAAITLDQQIAPTHPVELTSGGIFVGQDVAFVGFPFAWSNTQYNLNNGYPLPFVKAAIVSAFVFKNQINVAYYDGHNNPGFSGEPIAADHIPPKDPKVGPKIIGVVSGFKPESTPHPRELDPPLKRMNGYPVADDHVHLTNAGFFVGYGIKHAILKLTLRASSLQSENLPHT